MSEVSNPFINSIILAVVAAALSALSTWVFVLRANAKATARQVKEDAAKEAEKIAIGHQKLTDEVNVLKEKLTLVTAQVVPFNTAFQQILIAQLTHAHTPELDALMAKIGPPITLTVEEEKHLYKLLIERQKDLGPEISQEEREAALILPYVMRRARAEQEQIDLAEKAGLQMIGVVAVVGVPASAINAAKAAAGLDKGHPVDLHTEMEPTRMKPK